MVSENLLSSGQIIQLTCSLLQAVGEVLSTAILIFKYYGEYDAKAHPQGRTIAFGGSWALKYRNYESNPWMGEQAARLSALIRRMT